MSGGGFHRTLDITADWAKVRANEIEAHTLALAIGQKIKRLQPLLDRRAEDERHRLVADFESLAAMGPSLTFDEFDVLMSNLGQWAGMRLTHPHFKGMRACQVRMGAMS